MVNLVGDLLVEPLLHILDNQRELDDLGHQNGRLGAERGGNLQLLCLSDVFVHARLDLHQILEYGDVLLLQVKPRVFGLKHRDVLGEKLGQQLVVDE